MRKHMRINLLPTTRRATLPLAIALVALVAAGCGSSSKSAASNSSTKVASVRTCTASVGIEAPITGAVAVLGDEQLHFAELAVANDNAANHTHITLVQGDTQLQPAQAVTVSQQFISNPKIVAIVGPAGSSEVEAVGPLLGRAHLAAVSGSATDPSLTTSGKNPTFFRVVASDNVQGPQDARYIVSHLHPKALMIVDDQEAYSTNLVAEMLPIFKAAGIKVDHESVHQTQTDFSSLVAKITPQESVVVLPWQIAANAQQFGRDMEEQHKDAVIFGTDGLFSPGTFTIPGSYVSSFGPDITAIPADAAIVKEAHAKYGSFGTYGPPVYAAAHVVDEAIYSVCKAGKTPTRENVLAAIRQTDEPTSILGQPIRFAANGNLIDGKFFLFRINAKGQYELIPNAL
jgi:branched-chain amino acid transport system substrate-binding protein